MNGLRAVMLWFHIVAAVMAIGGVYFLRLILMPIVKKDGCEHAPALSDKVRAKFRKMIWHSIGLLVVSGGVLLWLMIRTETASADVPLVGTVAVSSASKWKQLSSASRHLLETKVMLALVLFGIALYLTIPAQASEALRKKAPMLLLVNLVLGFVILLIVAIRHVL